MEIVKGNRKIRADREKKGRKRGKRDIYIDERTEWRLQAMEGGNERGKEGSKGEIRRVCQGEGKGLCWEGRCNA